MDIEAAGRLVVALRTSARAVGPARDMVIHAQQLAQLPVPAILLLDDLERDYRTIAAAIEQASTELTDFVIGPIDARWDQIRQDASHNSYEVNGGIAGLYDVGVRSFELDIHRGAPTEFLTPGSWARLRSPATIIADHFDHRGGRDGDWRVYHVSGSADSEYEYLSDGLQAIAALPAADPITLFVDNKDDFGRGQSPADLDRLVRAVLGDRLVTPADLRARADDASSLRAAVDSAGWPTVGELQGKVMVVLTAEVDGYSSADSALFIARPPEFEVRDGVTVHLPDEHAVFFNASERTLGVAELHALQATHSMVRTYVHARCDSDALVNYRAIDVTPVDAACSVEH